MVATRKQSFAAEVPISITLNSLASLAARQSLKVDNSTTLYIEAFVRVTIKLAAGSPADPKVVYVYAYGSQDGTILTDNASGLDAAITLRSPSNLRTIGTILVPDAGALSYASHPFPVSAAFGYCMPKAWGIVVENRSGLAFDASGCSAGFVGVSETIG